MLCQWRCKRSWWKSTRSFIKVWRFEAGSTRGWCCQEMISKIDRAERATNNGTISCLAPWCDWLGFEGENRQSANKCLQASSQAQSGPNGQVSNFKYLKCFSGVICLFSGTIYLLLTYAGSLIRYPDWVTAAVIVVQSVKRSLSIWIPKRKGSRPKSQDKQRSPTK